jgi:formylglycine-generating enzyme required for sulfatase activity
MRPPGFDPAEGAQKRPWQGPGRFLYDKLVRKLDPEQQQDRVVFTLIWDDAHPHARPFYLMEHKVTNRWFRRFAMPGVVLEGPWRLGGVRDGKDLGTDPDKDYWPAFRMSAGDAHRFALWLGSDASAQGWKLDIPSAKQWDLASGLSAERLSPVPKGAKPPFDGFALAPGGPRSVFDSDRHDSPSVCKNMFSNGWEWTRSDAVEESKEVDFDRADASPRPVLLRAQTYVSDTPFQLSSGGKPPLFAQRTDEPSHEIGCRVVLELPNR